MSRPIIGDDVFRAVAHPVRRRILEMLAESDRPVGELFDAFRISRASLSRHLGVLRQARLVDQRRNGRSRAYFLRPRALRQVVSWSGRFSPQ